jgi:hypothetical protein
MFATLAGALTFSTAAFADLTDHLGRFYEPKLRI